MTEYVICDSCSLPIINNETDHECVAQGHQNYYSFEQILTDKN